MLRPVTPGYPFIATEFTKTAQDILNGADPQQALDQAVQEHRRQPEVQQLLPVSPTEHEPSITAGRAPDGPAAIATPAQSDQPVSGSRSVDHDGTAAHAAAGGGPADHLPADPDRADVRAGLHQRPAHLAPSRRSSSASTTSSASSRTRRSGRRCATRSSSPWSSCRCSRRVRSGLALLINVKMRGVNFFRTVYFLPVVTSMVVVSMLWLFMYQKNGLINPCSLKFGIAGPTGSATRTRRCSRSSSCRLAGDGLPHGHLALRAADHPRRPLRGGRPRRRRHVAEVPLRHVAGPAADARPSSSSPSRSRRSRCSPRSTS